LREQLGSQLYFNIIYKNINGILFFRSTLWQLPSIQAFVITIFFYLMYFLMIKRISFFTTDIQFQIWINSKYVYLLLLTINGETYLYIRDKNRRSFSLKHKTNFQLFKDATEILGDDFWDVMSDILPYIGPRIDVIRSENQYVIIVELPGLVSEESVSLHIQGMVLYIEGKIERPYIQESTTVVQDERYHGPFKRNIRLPEDCMVERMAASYTNGLLQIVIPTYTNEEKYPKQKIDVQFSNHDPFKGGIHYDNY